ncbi:MAG: hypothetical protein ACI8UO_006055 [Verrucomicrobiales bacterium]|jgi:hypothetical protein
MEFVATAYHCAGTFRIMNQRIQLLFFVLFAGLCFAQETTPDKDAINWKRAKQLYQQSQRGEALVAEDQAYLDRAKELRRQGKGRPGGGQSRQAANQRTAPERLNPISDMTAEDRYEGQDGGLYGGGRNQPGEELRQAAETQLAEIQPLDAEGEPATAGKIVFISISMSNATQEFSRFKQVADQAPEKSANVTIVDCAQGGQAMAEWVSPDARPWRVAMERLERANVTPNQVQVAWVKLANKAPGGSLKEHGAKLQSDTIEVLKNAKAKFPNLRIAYLGSRIWAGNATGGLNPEPYAYESGFVVRWLIETQTSDEAMPLLLWGPYIWAEGEKGRKLDDLVWTREDFAGDGVHPNQSGREKVAQQLLKFVTSDPLAKSWFVSE